LIILDDEYESPYFGSTGAWTPIIVLARQMLNYLSHYASPICVSYFSDSVSLSYPGRPGLRFFYLGFPHT
jgi:hypothetical protein